MSARCRMADSSSGLCQQYSTGTSRVPCFFLPKWRGRGPREEKRRRAQARRRRDGGAERSGGSGAQQHRLELPALQGGLGGVGHQGEVGHQGGGLLLRVVLAGRGRSRCTSGPAAAPMFRAEAASPSLVEGASRTGPAVAQVGLGGHGDAWCRRCRRPACPGCCRCRGQMISRSSRLLGADGLRLLDWWRSPGGRRCAPSPASGRGRCQSGCRCRPPPRRRWG